MQNKAQYDYTTAADEAALEQASQEHVFSRWKRHTLGLIFSFFDIFNTFEYSYYIAITHISNTLGINYFEISSYLDKNILGESKKAEESKKAKESKLVSEMLQDVYESCKNEAKAYEEDAHDDHTIESYMVENAALIATLAAKSLNEMKEEYSKEAYEAACNSMVESYTKKMDEMKESNSPEDAGDLAESKLQKKTN